MRLHSLTPCTVALLVPALVLAQVGCSAPPGNAPPAMSDQSSSATPSSKFDGESVFRGVFFGQGPIAKLFPETWSDGKVVAPAGALTNEALSSTLSIEIERMKAEGKSPEALQKLSSLNDELQKGGVDAAALAASYGTVVADAKVDRIVASLRSADPTFFDSFGSDMRSGDHVRVQSAFRLAQTRLQDAFASADFAATPGGSLHGDCAVLYVVVVVAVFVWVAKQDSTAPHSLEEDEYLDRLATRLATA